MLVDLSLCKARFLTSWAGFGEWRRGPSAGTRGISGYLLASTSPHALDVAAAYLLGITPCTQGTDHQCCLARAGLHCQPGRKSPCSVGLPDPAEQNRDTSSCIFLRTCWIEKYPVHCQNLEQSLLRPLAPVFISETLCRLWGDCYRSCRRRLSHYEE